jgi:superfamily II DNA or RNA helicase
MIALRPLRPHQEHAFEALRASLASGKRRPMLQAPTGFGKTLTAAHIIQRALDKGKRVAFTVPALSLIDQTVSAFEAEGIDCVGVMQGIHPRTDREQPVQVCSIQTIARRKRPEVDFVLVDEAHELHKEVFRWMADCSDIPFLGLSATPWSRGLGKYYDDLIIAATTKDLIDQDYLSRFTVFAPSQPDLDGVKTVAGDYHEGQLAERIDTAKLVGDVIETWQRLGENRPTLVYGVNRAHAEHLQQRFLEAGFAAAYIDCFVDRYDRERIFDKFRAGEIRVICNVATLSTGLDLPMVSCLIDARPTKSEIRFVQTVGRGLRTAPGKDRLVILDHSGNTLRLGLVTDIHHEHLDDGESRKSATTAKERDKPLPRLCEDCSTVLPQCAKVCPECGKVQEVRTSVEHRDGELVELGAGPIKRAAAQIFAEQEEFFGELRWIATVKGYQPGWAGHKFRERYGSWPNDWQVRLAQPREPSLKTKNWLRSRSIAYAKARAANG